MSKRYTREDLEYIIENYGKIGCNKVAKKLNRTSNAISCMADRLGVTGLKQKPAYIPKVPYSKHDIAWAAGILEADGCFHCSKDKTNKHYKRAISVNQLSIRREILEKLQDMFGGTIITFRKESCKDKEVEVWRISAMADIISLITQVRPYMVSKYKKDRAQKLLDTCELK